jgi:hypothetical protein
MIFAFGPPETWAFFFHERVSSMRLGDFTKSLQRPLAGQTRLLMSRNADDVRCIYGSSCDLDSTVAQPNVAQRVCTLGQPGLPSKTPSVGTDRLRYCKESFLLRITQGQTRRKAGTQSLRSSGAPGASADGGVAGEVARSQISSSLLTDYRGSASRESRVAAPADFYQHTLKRG